MIGYFSLNQRDEVAFAKIGEGQRIKSFRLVDGNCIMVTYVDASEEMLLDEIDQRVLASVRKCKTLLVAHVDETGAVREEYFASVDTGIG